jgi:hypothetical protein
MKVSHQPQLVHIYTYESRHLQIIAPPKCGTRYLTSTDYTNRELSHINELVNILNPEYKIYFVTRDPLEHLHSGLFTETLTFVGEYGESGWEKVLTDKLHHWSPTLYKTLFENWKLRKTLLWDFIFVDLSELTNLITEFGLTKSYDKTEYNFENDFENPLGLIRTDVHAKLKETNPEKYFNMERESITDRYFLYKLKHKIKK